MRPRAFSPVRALLAGRAGEAAAEAFGRRVLVVAAHPDDEVACAGALISRIERPVYFHLTDGAPRNLLDARSHGFATTGQYAAARRAELLDALSLVGAGPQDCLQGALPDQEAAFYLTEAAQMLRDAILDTGPDSVLCPPYEGGHPDHDAACFAVHAACELLRARSLNDVPVMEYASYHGARGEAAFLEFIPRQGSQEALCVLTKEQTRLKSAMMERFRTQALVLSAFPRRREAFRRAPAYDFTEAPHAGKLYYERFSGSMDKARWRELASEALGRLGLKGRQP